MASEHALKDGQFVSSLLGESITTSGQTRRVKVDDTGSILTSGAIQSASGTNTETSTTGDNWSSNTYTGAGEQNGLSHVGVSLQTDEAGTLFFDFSVDGTNWTSFPSNGFTVVSGVHEFHTAVKLGRYFRPRFVGTGGRSYFRLYTYYGNNFLPSNAPINQSLASDSDAITVRTASDYNLDVVRGFIGGQSGITKFGANPSVTASSTEDISFSGIINWLQAATTVRIKSGGNSADSSAGLGAQQVVVVGLDSNWNEATETITTNGASASSATTTSFIRVYRAYVGNVGTYTGANTGNIVIENSGGGTDLITIPAGLGQSEASQYTVPDGKTAYLQRIRVDSSTTKASDIRMFQRQNADDVTTPFTGKRLVRAFFGVADSRTVELNNYAVFPAKTDLWATITTATGASGAGAIAYDLILIDD